MPGVIDGVEEASPAAAGVSGPRRQTAAVDADDRWQAATAVREYELEADRFLIHVPSGAIYRLNATGQLVWGLLKEEAISGREIAGLLGELHTTVPSSQIRVDVQALLADLVHAELVVPA
nr:PqqD family protein [Guyparkeria hydrothermalis]